MLRFPVVVNAGSFLRIPTLAGQEVSNSSEKDLFLEVPGLGLVIIQLDFPFPD